MTVERTIVRRILLILSTFLFLLGCVAREETAEWITYHNQRYNFSFQHPPFWVITEGPVHIGRLWNVAVSLNSFGKTDFWITDQKTGEHTRGINPHVILNQLQPSAVYFQVGWIAGGPPRLALGGPELEGIDLSQVRQGVEWEDWDSEGLQRYWLDFSKWGRRWSILVYLVEPIAEADRQAVERVLDSFRFEEEPAAEEEWAAEEITDWVSFWANSERLPFHPATSGAAVGVYRVTTVRDGVDILVIVSYTWHQDSRFCRPLGCRRWIYRALANGDVWPERESGDYPFWLLRGKALRRMPDHRFLF